MKTTFRRWYFSRRGLILIPLYSVLLLCFYNECEKDYVIWPLGITLILLGELLRLWAIKHIGKDARKRNLKIKTLATTGPYAIVRNPLYISNIIISAGLCILSELIWFLPILLAILFIHYNIVVRCEEDFLFEKLGSEYLHYKSRVPRWIPKISGLRTLGLPQLSWRDAVFRESNGLASVLMGIIFMAGKEIFDDFIIKG